MTLIKDIENPRNNIIDIVYMANINHIDIVLRDNVSPTLFRFVVPDTTKGVSIKNIVGYPWSADSGIIFAGRDISRDRRTLREMDPTEDEFIFRVIDGRHVDDDPGEPMGAIKKRKKATKKKKKSKKKKKKATKKKSKKNKKGAIPITRNITKVIQFRDKLQRDKQRLLHHEYRHLLTTHDLETMDDMSSLLDNDVTIDDQGELNFREDQLNEISYKLDNYLAEE